MENRPGYGYDCQCQQDQDHERPQPGLSFLLFYRPLLIYRFFLPGNQHQHDRDIVFSLPRDRQVHQRLCSRLELQSMHSRFDLGVFHHIRHAIRA